MFTIAIVFILRLLFRQDNEENTFLIRNVYLLLHKAGYNVNLKLYYTRFARQHNAVDEQAKIQLLDFDWSNLLLPSIRYDSVN